MLTIGDLIRREHYEVRCEDEEVYIRLEAGNLEIAPGYVPWYVDLAYALEGLVFTDGEPIRHDGATYEDAETFAAQAFDEAQDLYFQWLEEEGFRHEYSIQEWSEKPASDYKTITFTGKEIYARPE